MRSEKKTVFVETFGPVIMRHIIYLLQNISVGEG